MVINYVRNQLIYVERGSRVLSSGVVTWVTRRLLVDTSFSHFVVFFVSNRSKSSGKIFCTSRKVDFLLCFDKRVTSRVTWGKPFRQSTRCAVGVARNVCTVTHLPVSVSVFFSTDGSSFDGSSTFCPFATLYQRLL